MDFKRHFEIEKIVNKDVDKAGEEETKKVRIVTFKKGEMEIILKGERDTIEGFKTGDNVEVKITSTQTELFTAEGYKKGEENE